MHSKAKGKKQFKQQMDEGDKYANAQIRYEVTRPSSERRHRRSMGKCVVEALAALCTLVLGCGSTFFRVPALLLRCGTLLLDVP
jgi:hypothetical protein